MPMLSRHRRYLGCVGIAVFALLLLGNLVPDPHGRGVWRASPVKPDNIWQEIHQTAQMYGLYFKDNFGFRASMPVLRRDLRQELDAPNDNNIYIGQNGRMFWARENTPEQSAGDLVRIKAVDRFIEMAAIIQRELKPLGTSIVVAIPPNTQSVELEDLPAWQSRTPRRPTEYDLLLAGLKADGVPAVDLRKAIREAPIDGPRYLKTDSHWNTASSVYAFNATMVAAGHPDWQVNPAEVLGELVPSPMGDLTRTMRMAPPTADQNYRFRIKQPDVPNAPPADLKPRHEHPLFQPYMQRFRPEGPRVLVLGDSFTVHTWTRLFAYTPVAEAAWMHFSKRTLGHCDFDFADVKAYKPDLVILARTERFFPCLRDAWPAFLPLE
ncbi:alginate O-acetyltransferase AlgX-related protein [Xanthobacteraceae bacterium A53D]